jgi:CubicO group peptidase (beta-lactamase class C family)
MVRWILISIFLFSFVNCQSKPKALTTDELALKKSTLQEKISSIQKKSGLPALQAFVVNHSTIEFSYSDGVRAAGLEVPLDKNDLFHLGSCTKAMTAILIGQLIDQKILDWNTTLSSIDPKQKMHPSLKDVTIEMLLAHRSGAESKLETLKVWPSLFDKTLSVKRARELLVNSILNTPAEFAPGSKFEYSNGGYVLLGWILEQTTNFSWEELMRNKIFNPLSMSSCGFGPAGMQNAENPLQPWPHKFVNNKFTPVPPNKVDADNPAAIGAAGTVHCSGQDWIKFLNEINYGLFKESTFIREETFTKLFSESAQKGITHSSFGVSEKIWAGGNVYLILGSNGMNLALAALAPRREMVLIVLTNAGSKEATDASLQVLKLLTEYVQ